jgi:hypothetical protein
MYSYFSDLHVDLLAQALLQPGEQRVGQTVGRYMPWWAFGFINRTYLVIATDRRLILVDHRLAWLHAAMRLDNVESIPWASVKETRLKGIFGKKLVVKGQTQSREFACKMAIPNTLFGLLAPMRNNVGGARAVANGFTATRGLAAGAMPAQLPAQQAQAYAQLTAPVLAQPTLPADYAQPYSQPTPQPPQPAYAQAYAQPAPPQAYAQAPAAQPQMPAFNSPGYASVPPASNGSTVGNPPARGMAPTPPRLPSRP